jgi:hypothetical protein
MCPWGRLGDKLGRVNGFRVAATVGIIGAGIQTGAINQAMVSLISHSDVWVLNVCFTDMP